MKKRYLLGWKPVLLAFTFPAIMALYAASLLLGRQGDGFADLAGAIMLAYAVVSAVIVGIVLFLLRHRPLRWWHALLLSIASPLLVALALQIVFFLKG